MGKGEEEMSVLPTDAVSRKGIPVATGCIDYFPDALIAVAELSRVGNDQHNPGKPLHWDRTKSQDEADSMMRHFIQRGTRDTDGVRHSTKVAWRALALLQKEIEHDREASNNVATASDCRVDDKRAGDGGDQGGTTAADCESDGTSYTIRGDFVDYPGADHFVDYPGADQ
jgi:hypothetical protein